MRRAVRPTLAAISGVEDEHPAGDGVQILVQRLEADALTLELADDADQVFQDRPSRLGKTTTSASPGRS
jgi:hypothetical protein